MTAKVHPRLALFGSESRLPALSACEHFVGSQKLIFKAFELQQTLGPIFDITCDCEDGAQAGQERAHAEMVAAAINSPQNVFHKAGVRIHDPSHPAWRQDIDIILGQAAERIAYITIPKATRAEQVREVIEAIQQAARHGGRQNALPVHVLIETHGALREVAAITDLPHIEVLDFGLMDFVSDHLGVIPASAMQSPGQFEHRLVVRAKAECVAAAVARGIVPAHNVCMNLKDAEVIRSDASRARNEFGFQRMWSIYPAQIVPIVEAMRPGYDEVTDAVEILLAAQNVNWGPIQHKGRLHDRATYRYFWSLLERAHTTGVSLPAEAQDAFFGPLAGT